MNPLIYFSLISIGTKVAGEGQPQFDTKHFLLITGLCLGIAFLVFCSGFFSSSETAFSTANQMRLKSFLEEKKKGAKQALWIAENYDRTITTILIGNNFVNIAATTLAAVVLGIVIKNPTISNIVNTVVMTIIVLIFGEILPKCRAKQNAEKTALRYAKTLFVIIKILTPITAFFMWLNRVMQPKKTDDSPTVTESELESIIDTMEDEGVIDSDDADLMQNLLDIGEKIVYDIMIPRVDIVAIDVESSVKDIKDIFFEHKFSRLPVYQDDKDHVIGILSERDFFTYLLNHKGENLVDITSLISEPLYVSKTMKVDDLIRRMQKDKKHMAIVSDEYGGTSGIVTMEDALEEIVGEIYDEYDIEESEEEPDLIKIAEDTYELSAETPLDYLFDTLELGKTPESSYTNVGGFLYSLVEKVPNEGEVVSYQSVVYEDTNDDGLFEEKTLNLEFTVLEVVERRIKRAKLQVSVVETEKDEDNDKNDKSNKKNEEAIQ